MKQSMAARKSTTLLMRSSTHHKSGYRSKSASASALRNTPPGGGSATGTASAGAATKDRERPGAEDPRGLTAELRGWQTLSSPCRCRSDAVLPASQLSPVAARRAGTRATAKPGGKEAGEGATETAEAGTSAAGAATKDRERPGAEDPSELTAKPAGEDAGEGATETTPTLHRPVLVREAGACGAETPSNGTAAEHSSRQTSRGPASTALACTSAGSCATAASQTDSSAASAPPAMASQKTSISASHMAACTSETGVDGPARERMRTRGGPFGSFLYVPARNCWCHTSYWLATAGGRRRLYIRTPFLIQQYGSMWSPLQAGQVTCTSHLKPRG